MKVRCWGILVQPNDKRHVLGFEPMERFMLELYFRESDHEECLLRT